MNATDPAPSLLVVDDDLRLQELLRRYLGGEGYRVQVVGDGRSLDEQLKQGACDMLILDVMLPGEDGLSICRRLRAAGLELPILMLTAKGDDIDRIIGLEIGADDYLAKPFNPRELLARVRALLRRTRRSTTAEPAIHGEQVCFGNNRLCLRTRTLTREGVRVAMTSGEFAVLRALVEHPRVPLSRDRLLTLARGRDFTAFDRSIDVQISRLRKMVEANPREPRYLQTVWGAGYVFVPDEDAP